MAYVGEQDRNIVTYCLISILAMTMLSFTIGVAQTNYQNDGMSYNAIMNQIQGSDSAMVQLNLTQASKGKNLSDNYMPSNAATNIFDQLGSSLNWLGAAGSAFSLQAMVWNAGPGLWQWAGAIGGIMGWTVMWIIIAWQISVGYFVLRFILPRMKG